MMLGSSRQEVVQGGAPVRFVRASRGRRRRLDLISAARRTEWVPEVTPAWLRQRLGEPKLRIVDVRSALVDAYIPGSVKLDAAASALAENNAPSVDIGEFAFAMARHGIDDADFVVLYDQVAEGQAAVWVNLLQTFGHEEAAALEGGFERWLSDRAPTEAVFATPPLASFTARRRK